jgi:hypothetical protein
MQGSGKNQFQENEYKPLKRKILSPVLVTPPQHIEEAIMAKYTQPRKYLFSHP